MKTKDVLRKKIMEDENFIHCPRLGNSLQELLQKNPDGVEDSRIEKVLLLPKKDIETIYMRAVEKLKRLIGIVKVEQYDEEEDSV